MRNLWSYTVIFCGHFPDGAEKFTVEEFEDETPHEWYLRQMLGSANFKAGPLMAFMSGNLCYQIEHHLFPDLPSNRYAEMSVRIKALCEKYELPYTTGSLRAPVRPDAAHAVEAVAARPLPHRDRRRGARDRVRARRHRAAAARLRPPVAAAGLLAAGTGPAESGPATTLLEPGLPPACRARSWRGSAHCPALPRLEPGLPPACRSPVRAGWWRRGAGHTGRAGSVTLGRPGTSVRQGRTHGRSTTRGGART